MLLAALTIVGRGRLFVRQLNVCVSSAALTIVGRGRLFVRQLNVSVSLAALTGVTVQ